MRAELTSHQYKVRGGYRETLVLVIRTFAPYSQISADYYMTIFHSQSYRVVMIHKVRSNTEVHLGKWSKKNNHLIAIH